MNEIRRVLCSKKTALLFCILFLLHSVFFIYQCNDMKENTLSGEDLQSYLEDYPNYVSFVRENAEEMLSNPLIKGSTSYAYRNVLKTGEDFAKVGDVVPVLGENRGIVTLLHFNLTNFVLLFIGIYLVMSFLAERQKGLFLLVRCTYNGRLLLTLQRVLSLLPGIAVPAVLLFGSALGISCILFPGADLTRPIQSVPEFQGVTLPVSVGVYLCLVLCKKILGCIVVCLLLFFCMSILRSSLCVILFISIYFAEYLLYLLLLPTDRLNILKYLNLYTIIFCPTDYGHYRNLNLWNHAVPSQTATTLLCLSLFLILTFACILQYTLQYPKAESTMLPLWNRIAAFFSKRKPQLTPFMWECKKLLFSQKALLILLCTLYLAFSSSQESSYRDFRSPYLQNWYHTYSGEITVQSVGTMQEKYDKLVNKLGRLRASLERQNELLVEYTIKGYETRGIRDTIGKLTRAIDEYEKQVASLEIVLAQAKSGLQFQQRTGILTSLFDPTCYDMLLQRDYRTVRQNYLYILIAVILMFSGIMACERSSHMEQLLHTLFRGRRRLFLRKLLLVFLLSIVCALSIHLLQFWQIGRVLPYHSLQASVQSLPYVQYIPFAMSIRTFLILLYILRGLVAFAMGLAVMAVSNYSKSRMTTIALSVFFLLVPMVLLSSVSFLL